MEITVEKIANLLLNPENRDKMRETKNRACVEIEEATKQIAFQRKKIDDGVMRLAAAKTDKENPKHIESYIKSFKERLERAKKEIAECQKNIEILQARLPSEARAAKVESIEQELKQYESNVNALISQKGEWTRLRDLISQAEELRKLD